ncbi:amidohydrolase [Archangium sp.]|uniref:amidohydrolase n=1 Tax=Archangium sp. TaxID=1872627 RepID=UPI002D6FCB23|nr:amidohydrolase family protein [Archangium sp.]HYO54146.1 amidohydrolase family protein [Archangium sp.]
MLSVCLALVSACTGKGISGNGKPRGTLFVGKVITMDDQGTIAEAVSVDEHGRILKVGTERELLAAHGPGMEIVRLNQQEVLMPGFVEPHMHILLTLMESLPIMKKVEPCLPPPYAEANDPQCTNILENALRSLRPTTPSGNAASTEFIMAMNLDPSRQQAPSLGQSVCGSKPISTSFTDSPKDYLSACVGDERPVFILDQSGHLAYVNQKAIDVTCNYLKSTKKEECPPGSIKNGGGEWVKGPDGQFTGLIREPPAYEPFLEAMAHATLKKDLNPIALLRSHPKKFIEQSAGDIRSTIRKLRNAGITTLADGGLTSLTQIKLAKLLAEQKDFPLRITALARYDVAYDFRMNREKLQPTGPACDPRTDPSCELPKWLGVGGIKLWVDGSTQGCTAWLGPPYAYKEHGHCEKDGEGRPNYRNVCAIMDQLRGLWLTGGWRFQMHVNGNESAQWAITAFAQLQQEAENKHPVLFIHDTLGTEDLASQMGQLRNGTFRTEDGKPTPRLDASVTHLIGHVAYWGNSFKEMLTEGAASNLDAVGFDRKHGVPFSLHSDSTVTPPRPLWYVEQAVTRRTWKYPDLKDADSYVLGPEHKATIVEALRGITLEAARQHELDKWLGSIEPGKVADFVVLDDNPLEYEQARRNDGKTLGGINVVRTYLNGRSTDTADK